MRRILLAFGISAAIAAGIAPAAMATAASARSAPVHAVQATSSDPGIMYHD